MYFIHCLHKIPAKSSFDDIFRTPIHKFSIPFLSKIIGNSNIFHLFFS